MRIVELSDHPGTLLREARLRTDAETRRDRAGYTEALNQHRERVARAARARDQARAQRRWLAWLRGIAATRRERRRAPVPPRAARPSDQEDILTAGIHGERLVVTELGRALGDEWTLIRGYRNRGGEIDHLLLGPRGLVAIESKHRNATVHCAGDRWWYTKFDNWGNAVDGGELTDNRGRSPSQQVNEPASQLEDFLRTRGHPVAIQRVVLLTHDRSRLGDCTQPTVHIGTSPGYVLRLLDGAQASLAVAERAKIERLIVRDHGFHQDRRKR